MEKNYAYSENLNFQTVWQEHFQGICGDGMHLIYFWKPGSSMSDMTEKVKHL